MGSYPAEVGRAVQYRTAAGKLRPAIVTAVPANLNVTAASRTSGVTTLTVANALVAGRWVGVNLADNSYNGLFKIASASGTQITYNQPGKADAGTSTGTCRDADTATLRVGHFGETFASKLRRIAGGTKLDRWIPK